MAEDGGTGEDATTVEVSPMVYGEGQSAWLALVTVVAFGALALSVVALVLATGDDGGGGSAAPAAGPGDQIEVVATEFAFAPADTEVLADEEVSVSLVNDGSVEHNWTVLEAGTVISSESEYEDSMAVAAVGDAGAGDAVDGSVNLAAGEYQVICTIGGHLDAGMQGTVVAGA